MGTSFTRATPLQPPGSPRADLGTFPMQGRQHLKATGPATQHKFSPWINVIYTQKQQPLASIRCCQEGAHSASPHPAGSRAQPSRDGCSASKTCSQGKQPPAAAATQPREMLREGRRRGSHRCSPKAAVSDKDTAQGTNPLGKEAEGRTRGRVLHGVEVRRMLVFPGAGSIPSATFCPFGSFHSSTTRTELLRGDPTVMCKH